ncbi:hypothetical protein [Virgibacillus oceani]|uniref:Uncharacterized protein n=1 Tax=Virgibacillus oceani TaxID=1479511 RepID=A0A917LX22_9BACI|nr:hypothetical protein [Virgibacillus oceani]GGG63351.1 hypothetical protein GCM10011398_03480 [Virgibacillus oceani]
MEGIFDAIFGNFLVVLAIIGGIVGFLKDKSKNDSDRDHNKPNRVPKPTATPSGGNYQSQHQSPPVQTYMNTQTMEEQQEEQMQQLAERMNADRVQRADNRQHDAIIGSTLKKRSSFDAHNKMKMKKQVKRNLTGKGLTDGIIMAEVLGPPRAVKPYKSVIESRRS